MEKLSRQTSSSHAPTISASPESLKRQPSNFSDGLPVPPTEKLCIMSPYITSVLDRTKTSGRHATLIIAAVAAELGYDINDITLSHSTVHRSREKFRAALAEDLKQNIQVAEDLEVHWDGKLLPDDETGQSVDRLPIVISGMGTEQLLGVPKMK